MPRRNGQRLNPPPLDLANLGDITPRAFNRPQRRVKDHDHAAAAERQRKARIEGAVDWSICIVPGCGDQLGLDTPPPYRRDTDAWLPVCYRHRAVVVRMSEFSVNQEMREALRETVATSRAIERSHEQAIREGSLRENAGHIYFVRLNGLIKAGWSRTVHERLRAYGPDVEVLAIYPGTRDDETNLHRQLTPARARGREWYEDGPIVAGFVAQAIEKHGEPEVRDTWTRPKEVIRRRSR